VSLPTAAGPGFGYGVSNDDDDRVSEGGECVDHVAADFGADREFLEFAVVSGVDAFNDPPGSDL